MKTFFTTLLIFFVSSLLFTILFSSCEKDPVNQEITKEKVSGFVQKGPYINGTQILMSELNASLEQTGKLFTSQIINDRGSFEINNIELTSSFVEFSANGFYFDEVKGELSSAPLTLFALADITDLNTVNVNILTHLEKRRVEYLVGQNISFSQAKSTAQAEVLAIFGIAKENMQGSENLDISVNNDDNAILLAISLILQGNRSVADLTELLANISTDIREDGVFDNQSILNALRTSTLNLNLPSIRQKLVARYNSLDVAANIPNFEAYIEVFLSMTAQEPVVQTMPATNVAPFSVTLNGVVNPGSAVTNVVFEYGLDDNFGNSVTAAESPVSGNTNKTVSAMITDLEPGSEYFFRVKAENDLGISIGNNMSFTTKGGEPFIGNTLASNITGNSAVLNSIVNPNMLTTAVTFEWGTGGSFQNSAVAIESPLNGEDELSVSVGIGELQANTEYQFRVKAENLLGTIYSQVKTLKTFHGTVMDADGNLYPTVVIGEQEWMAENLKTTNYRNGTPIDFPGANSTEWQNNTTGAYAWYNNDISWKYIYGGLYNWFAVNNSNELCPTGWHIPSNEEWAVLVDYIVSLGYPNSDVADGAGNALKSCRQISSPLGDECSTSEHPRWDLNTDYYGFDEFGFSALPTGYLFEHGLPYGLGSNVGFWTSNEYSDSEAWLRAVTKYGHVPHASYDKNYGNSVRCIKD